MGRDGYTGLAVLAASLALFWGTLGLERHPMVPVGPAFYPQIVLGVTAVMALVLIVSSFVVPAKAGARSASPQPNYALVLAAFAVFLLYAVALPYLGFRLSTFLFLLAMPVVLERPADRRRWILVLGVAIAGTLATYFLFEGYLHVLMPRGRWTGF